MTLIGYVFRELRTEKDVVREVSKKACFSRPFNRQHDKRSQKLSKSAQQQFWYIYWLIWKKSSWNKSFTVICKILGLFFNTLAADDNYCLFNKDNLTEPIQMQSSKIKKKFRSAFVHFWNLDQILNIYEKKMTVISYVFPKLPLRNDLLTSNMSNGLQRSLNLPGSTFEIFINQHALNLAGESLS